MRSFIVKEQPCPRCNYALDRISNPDGLDSPDSKSYTICINCHAVLGFNPDLSLRIPPKEEAVWLVSDIERLTAIGRIAIALDEVKSKRGNEEVVKKSRRRKKPRDRPRGF